MNWIVVIWSMVAAACLTLAMVHLVVWIRRTDRWAYLLFALTATMVAAFSYCDLRIMMARTLDEFARGYWLNEFSVFGFLFASTGFMRLYLRAGPIWLAASVVGIRTLVLALNYPTKFSINFSNIENLTQGVFFGQHYAVATMTLSGMRRLAEISEIGFFAFALWTTIEVWRRGERRKAILVSGSTAFFMLIAAGQAAMKFHDMTSMPFLVVPSFLAVIGAMGIELSVDVLRAAELTAVVQAREEQLLESERKVDLAARSAELGLWSWDIPGDEIWGTAKCKALYGIGADERVSYKRFSGTIFANDTEHVRQRIAASLESGAEFNAEYRVLLPDGSLRWIGARGRVERDSEGQPLRMLGVSLDITRRRLAEERAQLIVEASPVAMIMVDDKGTIHLANSQAERVFGYLKEEMIGSPVEKLVPGKLKVGHVEHRQSFMERPQSRPMGVDRELFGMRKSGREAPIEVGLTPIDMPEGRFVLAAITDISDRKKAELESAQHRNELAHLSRVAMLGELSGSLAHELNQPLASIMANAQAAQRFINRPEPDLSEVRDILQDIVDQDRRAGEVIVRLRTLLRKGEVVFHRQDLNETVSESLKLMRNDLINQGVSLAIELTAEELPVKGDRVQIQQVVINLVMNACDAMAELPRPERRLIVRTFKSQDGRGLSVVDRGIGIPEDKLDKVFEPFFTTKTHGMGLGLAVCRTIVTAHGGRLWATNNADRGASVHFQIPADIRPEDMR